MEITIGARELIAWTLTVISATLFIQNRLSNPSMQYYMALQGILMSCYRKAIDYKTMSDRKEQIDAEILCNMVSSDFFALTQHLMGIMKSVQRKEDLPFDVIAFVNSGKKDITNETTED